MTDIELRKTLNRVKKDVYKRFFKFVERAIKEGKIVAPENWSIRREKFAKVVFLILLFSVYKRVVQSNFDLDSIRELMKADAKLLNDFDNACLAAYFKMTQDFAKEVFS